MAASQSTRNFDVSQWLADFGMKEYSRSFIDNGYDTYELCSDLLDEDLDVMDITNVVHRGAIFYQAQLLKKGDNETVDGGGKHGESLNGHVQVSGEQSALYSEPWTSVQGGATYTEPWGNSSETYTEPWLGGGQQPMKPLSSPRMKPSIKPKPPGLSLPAPVGDQGGGGGGKTALCKTPKTPKSPGGSKPAVSKKQPRLAETVGEATQQGHGHLTKLQLKLKLRDELVKDHVDLSDPTYCMDSGSMDEKTLINLAEVYAERFSIESLEIYDALGALWTHMNNRTEFATPQQDQSSQQLQPSAANYIQPVSIKKQGKKEKRKKGGNSTPKVIEKQTSDNYAEPFDAVLNTTTPTNQSLLQKAPEPPSKSLSKPEGASKTKTMASKKSPEIPHGRSSLTLPSPGSPSLSVSSSSSEEAASGRSQRSRHKWNIFRKSSSKEEKTTLVDSPKSGGSMENISTLPPNLKKKTKRQSLQPGELSGLPRSKSSFPVLQAGKTGSDSDESTSLEKKLSGSLGSLTDAPTIPHTESGNSSSSSSTNDHAKSTTSRIKSIRLAPPGAAEVEKSDYELSNVVEVYVAGSDKPLRFKRAKSSEQLDKLKEEEEAEEVTKKTNTSTKSKKKPGKTGGFLSRLLKPRSKDKHKSKTVPKQAPLSIPDEEHGLTGSVSMPNIVAASIHSEYTDILDTDSDLHSHTEQPPELPKRFLATQTKKSHPLDSLASHSPSTSPVHHHLLMIKSESNSSSELVHPAVQDDIIEITVPKQKSVDSLPLKNPDFESTVQVDVQSQSISSLEKTLTPSSAQVVPFLKHPTEACAVTNSFRHDSNSSVMSAEYRHGSSSPCHVDSRCFSEPSHPIERTRSDSKPPVAPKPQYLTSTLRRTGSDTTPNSTLKPPTPQLPETLSSPSSTTSQQSHTQAPPKPVRGKNRHSMHSPSHHSRHKSHSPDKKHQTLDFGSSPFTAQTSCIATEGARGKKEGEVIPEHQHRPLRYSATLPNKNRHQRPPKPARLRRSASPSTPQIVDTSLEDLLALANLFHLSSKLRLHGISSAEQLRSLSSDEFQNLPLNSEELQKLQRKL